VVWDSILGVEPTNQYGRPFLFHQQAHRANWEGAWAEVRAPVFVIHGEYDWLMSKAEHERIATIINGARPGNVSLHTQARTDHHFEMYPSQEAAFAGRGGMADDGAVTAILNWISSRRR
jgi:pimeloyl-ACP methyl ester carboxylesterase